MEDFNYIKVNFSQQQIGILNFCLSFIMFGVALEIDRNELKELASNLKSTLAGLFSQMILLPMITFALIYVSNPPMAIAAGMILVGVCPGGNLSNYATKLANGNVSLSIALTTVSSLLAAITTPLWFYYMSNWVFGRGHHFKIDFFEMLISTTKLIFVPLAVGLWISHRYAEKAVKVLPVIKKMSLIIFLSFIVIAIYSNIDNIKKYLHLVFIYVLLHNTLALLGSYGYARLFGIKEIDCRAIAIETAIQNSGLALVLVFNFFEGNGGMALVAAWWSIWHLISAFSIAKFWSSKDKKTNITII